jgi:uncharacterized membrane protein YkvA (DUF1232 family)
MKLPAYRRYFTRTGFWSRMGRLARAAGTQAVYRALLLYYAYEREDTPKWAKRTILGALGYLLMPLDAVPDLTPILGYTDDFTVLGVGLATVAAYVNDEVRQQARGKLRQWLPEPKESELEEVERQL